MSARTRPSPAGCPACGAARLQPMLAIDDVPVFCNVLWPSRDGARGAARGNLHLAFCPDCSHVTNRAFDPALVDYTQQYENALHFSPRFRAYADRLAHGLRQRYGLRGKTIVEIGAGDGSFLRALCAGGENRGIGFDPGYRPVPENDAAGLTMIPAPFQPGRHQPRADLLICRHVLEHIPRPATFLPPIAAAAAPGTILFFEVPSVQYTLVDLGIWDLIYEHVSYFSARSLQRLFQRAGLRLLRLEKTFGGQFLTVEATPGTPGPDLPTDDLAPHAAAFAAAYRRKLAAWNARLNGLVAAGQRAVVWGAGSKGVSFLNSVDSRRAFEHVVDVNPRKQGMFVAGSGQEIVPPAALPAVRPDLVVIMNPNYEAEIRQQLAAMDLRPQIVLA